MVFLGHSLGGLIIKQVWAYCEFIGPVELHFFQYQPYHK